MKRTLSSLCLLALMLLVISPIPATAATENASSYIAFYSQCRGATWNSSKGIYSLSYWDREMAKRGVYVNQESTDSHPGISNDGCNLLSYLHIVQYLTSKCSSEASQLDLMEEWARLAEDPSVALSVYDNYLISHYGSQGIKRASIGTSPSFSQWQAFFNDGGAAVINIPGHYFIVVGCTTRDGKQYLLAVDSSNNSTIKRLKSQTAYEVGSFSKLQYSSIPHDGSARQYWIEYNDFVNSGCRVRDFVNNGCSVPAAYTSSKRASGATSVISGKQLGFFRVTSGTGNLKDTPYEAGNNMGSVRVNIPIASMTAADVVEVIEVVGNSYEASDPGNHQFAHLKNDYYIFYNHLEFLYEKLGTAYFPVICTQRDIKVLPFAEAANVRTLSGNTPLHVVAIYENKYGNIWYGVSDEDHGNQVGFVNINNVQADGSHFRATADTSKELRVPSGVLTSGNSFGLRGTIITNASIYEVRAEIVSRTTNQIVKSAYCRPSATATSVTINSSVNGRNINDLMTFSSLPVDYYTYQVCVIFGYNDGNGACIGDTLYLPEFQSNFQIGNPSGEEPQADIVTPIGNEYVTDIELRTSSGKVNNTTVNLSINGTLQISANVLPTDATRKDVGWTSSNTEVATVSDSGLITAHQVGQTVITCRAKDSQHFSTSFTLNVTCSHGSTHWVVITEATQTTTGTREEHCDICSQVIRTETIPATATLVSSITITRNGTALAANASITMDIGDEIQLDKTVQPSNATNGNVTWSSSNAQVVSVSSNGRLLALKNGTAVIICSATDNSGVNAVLNVTVQCSHRETIWVTIQEATSSQTGLRELHCLICNQTIQTEILPQITVPVSLVFLNRSELTMKAGTDFQLEAEVYPANASNRAVVWASSDPSIASVSSSGTVVAKRRGIVVISATAVDGSNLSAECEITIWEDSSELPAMTATGFAMPSSLTQIDAEAFAGIPVTYLKLPGSVQSIGSMAFAECPNLTQIFIPARVTTITHDAFEGSFFVSIVGYRNTAAESFAADQGIPFIALDPEATAITVPTGLTIGGDSEANVGTTLQLNGNVAPANATVRSVKWRSSNTSIAAVSNEGIVTAISPGVVTITAISDGDTSIIATKNITVRPPYTIIFDANGGSTPSPASKSVTYGSTYGSLATSNKTGYSLAGWYTAASGGTEITSTSTVSITSTQTLYAQWTPNQYPITLNNQYATSAGSTSVTATYDAAMPAITKPTKTGHTFKGYYTAQDGRGTQYYTEAGVSVRNWNLTSPTTLYAYWVPNSYTYSIIYRSSNNYDLGTSSETKTFGTTNTITPPAKEGYTTPAAQNVVWDATSKTITFTYPIIPVSFTTKSGNFWQDGGITYSVTIEYQNRTADSIQIRISCTLTKQRETVHTPNGHVFDGYCNGVRTPTTTILAYNEWNSNGPKGKSKTATSSWITVQNLSATQTSLDVAFTLWQVNSSGSITGNNAVNTTWTVAIPTY